MKFNLSYLIVLVFLLVGNCSPKSDSQEKLIERILKIYSENTLNTEDLSQYCEYIEDKEGVLSFEEIQSNQKDWKLISNHKVNFGFNPSYFWIRFSVQNLSQNPLRYIFEISFPKPDLIEFYSPNEKNEYTKTLTGDLLPYDKREIKSLGFPFERIQAANTTYTYYIRTKSIYNGSVLEPTLFSLNSFQDWNSRRNLINGLIYGLSGIMTLYNLLLFFTIRERVYLYVSIATFFFLILLMCLHGSAYKYLYPNFPWLQNHDLIIFPNIILIFTILYANEYLELKIKIPRIKKINDWMMGILVIIPFLLLILVEYFPSLTIKLIIVICMFVIIFLISIGIYLCTKKYRPAYYYVASFGASFTGTLVFLVTVSFILIPNAFIYWSFQVGYSIMLILLSLGLADKINFLKNDLKEANSSLEKKVEIRTEELSFALKSIRSDLNTAKKIQISTLPRKVNLHDLLTIEVKYLPMNEVGGDFYDIIKLNENVIRIFLADATGHGVQAALMTMAINSEYQNTKTFPLSPGEVLTILNQQYYHRYYYLNAYFTCVLIDIDLEKNKLYYSAGGHPDQFLYKSANLNVLSSTGKLMGVTKDAEFKTLEFDFSPNDRILLFTDGIFEEFNEKREEFGEERFSEVSLANRKLPNNKFLEKIIETVFSYLGKISQQDDITLLSIERK